MSNAIHEDLCGGESAAEHMKTQLLQEADRKTKAKEAKALKGQKTPLDVSKGSSDRFECDNAASSVEGHHRSKSISAASRVCLLSPTSYQNIKDGKSLINFATIS